jgi:hypothetical protein
LLLLLLLLLLLHLIGELKGVLLHLWLYGVAATRCEVLGRRDHAHVDILLMCSLNLLLLLLK